MKLLNAWVPRRRELAVILGATLVLALVVISSGQADSKFTPVQRDEHIWWNQIAIGIIGAAGSFAVAWAFWKKAVVQKERDALAEDHRLTVNRLQSVEITLAGIQQQVIPITAAFQAILIKDLTHYHTPEMDALMKKIGPPNTLTPEESDRLFNVLLPEREKDMGELIDNDERTKAHILEGVVKLAVSEAKKIADAEALKLQLVSVPAVVGVPAASVVSAPEK